MEGNNFKKQSNFSIKNQIKCKLNKLERKKTSERGNSSKTLLRIDFYQHQEN